MVHLNTGHGQQIEIYNTGSNIHKNYFLLSYFGCWNRIK